MENLEAQVAKDLVVVAEAALLTAQKDGNMALALEAEMALADAKKKAYKETVEAEIAQAEAVAALTGLEATKARAHANLEQKQARVAEDLVAAAEQALAKAQLIGNATSLKSAKKQLTNAKAAAETERNEAKVAVADAEAAMAQAEADAAAALALEESAEAKAAAQRVTMLMQREKKGRQELLQRLLQ